MSRHEYALLTPWYTRERAALAPTDEPPRHPVIQKYVTTDFVERLLVEPQDSIQFDPNEDVWSYTCPHAVAEPTPTPRPLSNRVRKTTNLRKLYQQSHERFYTVLVELVCDEPGFPRLSSVEGLEVGFVMRRIDVSVRGSRRDIRALTLAITRQPLMPAAASADVVDPDIEQALAELERAKAALLDKVTFARTIQAWKVDAQGQGAWRPVDDTPATNDASPPPVEQELPMWALPSPATACDRAKTRSLWFGVVPTYSGDMDPVSRQPKLDDRAIYVLQCFVREPPPAGHEHCPPRMWWSDVSEPFRLAAFFDPDGTKNRRVRVKLPDLRALEALAGGPPSGGGVEFERPPGSQLHFGSAGKTPTSGSAGGTEPENCTFAIELITIVASFVFSLFLPVVVIVFQLWWLLALRFCWPPKDLSFAALQAYLATTPPDTAFPITSQAARQDLGDLLGVGGEDDGAALSDRAGGSDAAHDVATRLVAALSNRPEPTPAEPVPEPIVEDPLCEVRP